MQAEIVAGGARQGNRNRWILLAAVAVSLAALGIYGYRFMAAGQQSAQQTAPAQAAAVTVRTAQVTRGPISASLSYSGDVKAASQVSVLPKGTGRIEKLNVDVGSRVRKGDVIAQLDAGSLKAQLSQTQANLAAAQAKYASLQAGPRAEQVAQAQLAVESAQARLDLLRKGAREEQLQAAQAQVDSARANVEAAQAKLDTVKLGPTQGQWGQALAAVESARANVKAAEEKLADVKAGPKAAEFAEVQARVDAALAALSYAQDQNAKLKDGGSDEKYWATRGSSAGESAANLQAKQTAYNSAVAALDLLKSRPLAWEVAAAQTALDTAKASFDAATATVEQMKRGATKEEIHAAEAGVAAAQGQQVAAEANLRLLKAGPTDEDVKQAENAVVAAGQQLALTQNPYTSNDLEMAQAGVMQSKAAVEAAQIGLGETAVLSPMDGVVSERLQSVGQLVGPSSPIVSIQSPDPELTLAVEETQIGQLSERQKAEIIAPAYPGIVFSATVTMIAPSADPRSRTFQVKVRPANTDGKLRPGMFAQVRIVTQEKDNALMVPKEAVVARAGQTSVFVVKGDTVQARPVKLGVQQNGFVEVVSGLQPGEEVVAAGQADLRDGDRVTRS